MTLSIHGIAASRALRPLWAAIELGLDFKHVPTPYQGGATRTPEFLALNPNGHIPVVVDERPEGEVVVWESMACALREDAEALRWSFWVMGECEADALTVLMHRVVMPPDRRKPELADAAERRLAVPLRVIEQHLARQHERGEAHLAAARFTVADLCVASVLQWLRPARGLMAGYPLAGDWLKACVRRPAFHAAQALGGR